MASSINVNTQSWLAPLLHAAKYPLYRVEGLLIGTVKDKKCQITQAIPLFHSGLLSPMMELATAMVSAHRVIYCRGEFMELFTPTGREVLLHSRR